MACPMHIHALNTSSNLLWVKRMRATEEIYDAVCLSLADSEIPCPLHLLPTIRNVLVYV